MQLFGDGGYAAGEPALWTRARVVHGSDGDAAGTVRVCQRRNGIPGRSGRNIAADAGKASAGNPERRDSASGLARSAADQRAADRRDEPGFTRGGAGGTFPRRSFLPAEFDPDPHSFADGTAGRYSAAGAIVPEEIQHRVWKKHFRADAAGADGAAAARVAGKC